MRMALGGEPDNVLVSLRQSLPSNSKLVEAILAWNVGDDVSKSVISLNLFELVFKPRHLSPWVLSVVHKPPVLVVASLGVKTDDLGLGVELEWLRVVPELGKDCLLVLGQPVGVSPSVLQVVDRVI